MVILYFLFLDSELGVVCTSRVFFLVIDFIVGV